MEVLTRSRAGEIVIPSDDADVGMSPESADIGQMVSLGNFVLNFSKLEDGPEIFYTLQGEGASLGKPSTFARLSACNLQCNWCDTPNTWVFTPKLAEKHDDGEVYDRAAETVTLGIGEAVDRILEKPGKRLVLTGGEPLLQRKALVPFINELRERSPGHWVEVETNGTIPPGEELTDLVNQFNISVKLANSGNSEKRRRKSLALTALADMPHANFKFVVADPVADMPEVDELVSQYEIPSDRVYLMPEGRGPEEVNVGLRGLAEVCKARGYNLTPRMHIDIWGDKRGV
jgi:7-carboxy-7-deazaguanine synthase